MVVNAGAYAMNILGVGPAEFLFILILGLLVIGPERLPEIAHSLGRLVARVMFWQQQSPEVRMFQQIRTEFEQEIQQLRDELAQTQQQLVSNLDSVKDEGQAVFQDFSKLAVDPTKHASEQKAPRPVPTSSPNRRQDALSQQNMLSLQDTSPQIDSQPVELHPHRPDNVSETPANGVEHNPLTQPMEGIVSMPQHSQLPPDDMTPIDPRIQALMMDLHALLSHLKEQGCLAPDWVPPSHAQHDPSPSSLKNQ